MEQQLKDVVAVYYEERCALDDDYGKRRQIDLFASRATAKDYLMKIGFKLESDREDDFVYYQYHSEVHASIHNIRWRNPF